MRILVVYAHPVEDSFNAAIHAKVLGTLRQGGHAVDDLDLYAAGFNPVLGREERLRYHDTTRNVTPELAPYVERLRAAEGVVFVFPTWCFGLPAILKGFFDRVLMPGVSFALEPDGSVRTLLHDIRKVLAVSTFGRPWWMVTFGVGNLPRAQIVHYFRRVCHPEATADFIAHYDMNRSTPKTRAAFLAKVESRLRSF